MKIIIPHDYKTPIETTLDKINDINSTTDTYIIKLDINISKDHELVVTRDRYTNKKTKQELLELGVLTFDRVVRVVEKTVPIMINIRDWRLIDSLIELLVKFIQNGWKSTDFIVSSFDHVTLKMFHEKLPSIKLVAFIKGVPLGYPSVLLIDKMVEIIAIDKDSFDESLSLKCRACGLEVWVYTIDTEDDYHSIKNCKVEGIIRAR